jgi:hypothetical protein
MTGRGSVTMERYLQESTTYVESVYAESTMAPEDAHDLEIDQDWIEEQEHQYTEPPARPPPSRPTDRPQDIQVQDGEQSLQNDNQVGTPSRELNPFRNASAVESEVYDPTRALNEQIRAWRTNYEALAKLYSQLRLEHLDVLGKFKSVQIKAIDSHASYDALAKLYTNLRNEHLDLLQKFKAVQLKAAAAQRAISRQESLEQQVKDLTLALE